MKRAKRPPGRSKAAALQKGKQQPARQNPARWITAIQPDWEDDHNGGGASSMRSRKGDTVMRQLKGPGPGSDLEAMLVRLSELYDFAPIPYVSFDRVGRIEEINFAAAKLMGKPRNAILGQPFASFVAKIDRTKFQRHLLSCRGRQSKAETDLTLRAGSDRIPVRLSTTPTFATLSGGVVLYQTVVYDLRERMAAEAAFRKGEERFRRYFDLGLVGI